MRIVVIGAGALGGSFGARLARAGHEVTLVDMWAAHVAAINEHGLRALGVPEPVEIRVAAACAGRCAERTGAGAGGGRRQQFRAGGGTGRRLPRAGRRRPDAAERDRQCRDAGSALGRERVVGGSTMCSFRTIGPGAVEQTNVAKTIVGELDGTASGRVTALRDLLRALATPPRSAPTSWRPSGRS